MSNSPFTFTDSIDSQSFASMMATISSNGFPSSVSPEMSSVQASQASMMASLASNLGTSTRNTTQSQQPSSATTLTQQSTSNTLKPSSLSTSSISIATLVSTASGVPVGSRTPRPPIAAIVIPVLVAIILIAAGLWFLRRHRRNHANGYEQGYRRDAGYEQREIHEKDGKVAIVSELADGRAKTPIVREADIWPSHTSSHQQVFPHNQDTDDVTYGFEPVPVR